MTRQEFLKIAAERYSLFFEPGAEDVEKDIRLRCGEFDNDISAVIEFGKWLDHITFRRAETKSDV